MGSLGCETARSSISALRVDWGRGLTCLCCLRLDLYLDSGAKGRGEKAVEIGWGQALTWSAPEAPERGLHGKGWEQVSLSWEQFLSKVTLPAPLAREGDLGGPSGAKAAMDRSPPLLWRLRGTSYCICDPGPSDQGQA